MVQPYPVPKKWLRTTTWLTWVLLFCLEIRICISTGWVVADIFFLFFLLFIFFFNFLIHLNPPSQSTIWKDYSFETLLEKLGLVYCIHISEWIVGWCYNNTCCIKLCMHASLASNEKWKRQRHVMPWVSNFKTTPD